MRSQPLLNRIKKLGMPAGTLLHCGEAEEQPIQLRLVQYSFSDIAVNEDAAIELCHRSPEGSDLNVWVHIQGLHDTALIEKLGQSFDLHSLVLEDILNTGQRAKIDVYQHQLFIVLRSLQYDIQSGCLQDEQISIVLGTNYLLLFSEGPGQLFTPLYQRLNITGSKLRSLGVDYLCHALIDTLVDYQFIALQHMNAALQKMEITLLNDTSSQTLQKIQILKSEIALIHKAVWPLRDIVGQLIRSESHLIGTYTKIYFHDVKDHVIQAIDSVNSFQEIAMSLVDLYMSYTSHRLNETMKLLTVVSTIFVPMTFLASVYGMNFAHMPGVASPWGFTIALILMLVIAISMLSFFRQKRWI